MITFLHISDLHFTTDAADSQFDQDSKLRTALVADLGKEDRKTFDGILVTGDIAYHGRAEEFTRAKAWIEDLRKVTGSPPEALFVVPGNHDVNQAKVKRDSSLWELHQSLRKAMSHEERCHSLDRKLQDDSLDFLTAMTEYRAFASEYGCPTNPDSVAWMQALDGKRLLEDGTPVRLHGLNSALISDSEDTKANLLLGSCQFHHFDSDPNYVNIALSHHPHTWLIDGSQANDYFRSQAHIVLSGHDHAARCYMEGSSLRIFAGAVHPARREPLWEPCYHVLRLAIETTGKRQLIASLETRVWRDRDKCFGPSTDAAGSRVSEFRIQLPPRTMPVAAPANSSSTAVESKILSNSEKPVAATPTNDALIAARRKLIVHFFRLGTIDRYKVVMDAGVWEEGDDAFDGQARWARVFERAERANKFQAMWTAIALKDETLSGQPNPFNAGT